MKGSPLILLLGYPPDLIREHADDVERAIARTAKGEDAEIAALRIQMLSDYRGTWGADSDNAAHPIQDDGAHHSEMMPPT